MHGGEFSIQSREGEGTSVTITLPAHRVIRHIDEHAPIETDNRVAA